MRLPSDLDVLRRRDFRLVFGASLVSVLGDGVLTVALTFAVLDLTGSATDLGIVLACETVALVAALLIGGVVADRAGRRTVMIAADLVRLAGQAAIGALLVAGDATIAEIAVSQLLIGAAGGFFTPASSGLLPLLAGERLQQANALRGMAMSAGRIAGPAIAGVLVVTAGPGWAVLIDAASYGVSALLLARVRRDHAPAPDDVTAGTRPSFLTDLRQGFDEVRSRTWVWSIVVVFAFTNAIGAAFPVLGALVAKRDLGGAGAWAAILAFRAAGSLLAGATLLRLSPRRPLLVAVEVGMISALPLFLLAIPAPLVVIMLAGLVSGVCGMTFNTLWETTLQRHIPPEARSRVSAYDWFGSAALTPLGLVVMGPLAAAVGVSAALLMCGGLDLLSVGGLLAVRDIRTLPPGPAAGPPE